MTKKNNEIVINDKDGFKYAKISGDFNKIHLNNLEGYNSIYGEKVCHGCYVLEKFLQIIFKEYLKFKKIKYLSAEFNKYIKYNSKITLIKLQNNNFSIKQDNIIKGKLKLSNQYIDINSINDLSLKRYKFYNLKKIALYKNDLKLLFKLLQKISHHVGMIYPGKNSIIESLKINYIKKPINLKQGLYSNKVNKNYPFIDNYLYYKNFLVQCSSIVRPSLKKDHQKPNFSLNKLANNNILIIGASNGLGLQTLNLFKANSKIKIVATYYKNKIYTKNKNIILRKINIIKDVNKIVEYIYKYKIHKIFYFPTSKISLSANLLKINEYKKIYINLPLSILKKIKKYEIKFFYPSTVFIENSNRNTKYSQIKLEAEKKLSAYCKKNENIDLLISRLPQINTKQNLNILNYKYPSLIKVLNNDDKLRNIFFK
jgi:hypothetical protein